MVNYEVFLSFRGPDTRNSLVEYLYDQLKRLDIVAFLDHEEIRYGDGIGTTIVDAIKRSDICVPIFSQDFASSPACLMEVAQMVESNKTIFPIFFFVEPCDVRHQRGTYEKSFAKHERKNRYPGLIEKWKDALKKIANKRGPEFKKANLGENGGIKERFYKDLFSGFRELEVFISELWKLSRMKEQDVAKNLVGRDEDVQEMMRKLGFDYQDGQVVNELELTRRRVFVVWGLPTVGKTTLTKVVFHKISHLFEGCSFLENVRDYFEQKREDSLQKKLIRELKRGVCPKVNSSTDGTSMIKKMFQGSRVLIVLDDVDDFKQIEALAGELTWFGPGSTIILTTRKKEVIELYKNPHPETDKGKVVREHEVSHMNENHALQLFYKHAFRLDRPLEGYENWSSEITYAVGHLPFAIEMVGRYLYGKREEVWMEILNDLRSRPQENVEPVLKDYFQRLSHKAQQIFLDIACFFTGVEERIPCYMWAACGWDPYRSVGDLQNISFLKIGEENEFWMHNQLKFFGREIVKNEDIDHPRRRSRLWDCKDVQTTLNKKKGTSRVEALRVTPDFNQVDGEVFHHLSNLRFLELDNVDIEGNPVNLLPNLVWLDWRGCQEKSKLFAFKMENLVVLNLCSSSVKLNLEDWRQLMEKARSLKVLNLKDCTWVKASLEFPASSLLKCLILEGCLYLKEPNETISNFENLVSLNMKHCQSVKHLPQALCSIKALKELLIDGTKIRRLHFEEGSLPALEILSACECEELREVTDSIGLLKNLRKLTLRSCKRLRTLPHVFGELVLLQELDLSYSSINELPSCVKDCKKLQVLKMVRTFLKGFPEAIKDLKELKELDFTHCESLSGGCNITELFSLRILKLKGTGISEVLFRDEGQFCLHILEVDDRVTKHPQTSQNKSSVSKLKRKRKTRTSQKDCSVSKHKKKGGRGVVSRQV